MKATCMIATTHDISSRVTGKDQSGDRSCGATGLGQPIDVPPMKRAIVAEKTKEKILLYKGHSQISCTKITFIYEV